MRNLVSRKKSSIPNFCENILRFMECLEKDHIANMNRKRGRPPKSYKLHWQIAPNIFINVPRGFRPRTPSLGSLIQKIVVTRWPGSRSRSDLTRNSVSFLVSFWIKMRTCYHSAIIHSLTVPCSKKFYGR